MIFVIAFFVVQWDAAILLKLPVIVLGSFVVTIGVTEVVRRIKPVRALFGMRSKKRTGG